MKQILLIFAIALTSMLCSAQSGQVAVLYHNEEVKTFYSSSAFKNAMANATDGDIITLSPGSYESSDITKAVTIRGAGIGAIDSISTNGYALTSISGDVKVTVPVNDSGYTLSIEGINFQGIFITKDVENAVFSKIRFNRLMDGSHTGSDKDSCGRNLTFVHCIIGELNGFTFGVNLFNCLIESTNSNGFYPENITYTNCVIHIYNNRSSSYNSYNNISFNNCIFIAHDKCYIDYSFVNSCVWFGPHNDNGAFQKDNAKSERHNSVVPDGTEIFVNGSFYVLNNAGLEYRGNDGTQVGLYGSELPFSTKTSYPRIKKLHIAPESTDDGLLKIEFELDADI